MSGKLNFFFDGVMRANVGDQGGFFGKDDLSVIPWIQGRPVCDRIALPLIERPRKRRRPLAVEMRQFNASRAHSRGGGGAVCATVAR